MFSTNINKAIIVIHGYVTKGDNLEKSEIETLEMALNIINEQNKDITNNEKDQIIFDLKKLSKFEINNKTLQKKLKNPKKYFRKE